MTCSNVLRRCFVVQVPGESSVGEASLPVSKTTDTLSTVSWFTLYISGSVDCLDLTVCFFIVASSVVIGVWMCVDW